MALTEQLLKSERFYKRVRSIQVPGNSWAGVDEFPLPQIGVPFKEGHIDSLCRFVVRSRGGNETSPQLVQVSPAEQRTFEVNFGGYDRVIFADEYGNLFSCLDVKGNKSTIIRAKTMNNAPSGFAFWGLQESDSIARAVRASDFIRSLGVDAEIILKIMEPSQIPYKGHLYSTEDFKAQLIRDVLANAAKAKYRRRDSLQYKDIPAFCEALMGMSFVETVRGKQIKERIFDLHKAPPDIFRRIVANAFWFYNFRNSRNANSSAESESFKLLDPENREDIANYFEKTLPTAIGENYATLHKNGVLHVHPHLQNIDLLGGIKDVDSAKGAPLGLGDADITEDEVIEEMQRLLYGYWNRQEGRGLIPLFRDLNDRKLIPTDEDFFFPATFESYLVMNYAYTRGWQEDWLAHLSPLYRIINHRNRAAYSLIPGMILDALVDSGQLKYTFELKSIEEMAEEMFNAKADFWRDFLSHDNEEGRVVGEIFSQSEVVGREIIRKRVADRGRIALEAAKERADETASQAYLELVALRDSIFLPLEILDRVYPSKDERNNDENPKNYILSMLHR